MLAIKDGAGRFQFHGLLRFAPAFFLFLAVMTFFTQWALMRFLWYDGQYQTLGAQNYNCQVYTAEDYRKLSDPTLDIIDLSNGSRVVDRTPAWYDAVLPQIKRVDTDHYVQVTTLGTAHYLRNWLEHTMPIAIFCLAGLAASIYLLRRPGSRQAAQREAS